MGDFTPPPRARFHCRSYSYAPGLSGGPHCAAGIDQSGGVEPCMSEPKGFCPSRAEWTEDERVAWAAWGKLSMARLIAAVAALPRAIPLRTGGEVDCPNCDGRLRYDRWHRGAEIKCSTPFCCGAHFNIAAGVDWPAPSPPPPKEPDND